MRINPFSSLRITQKKILLLAYSPMLLNAGVVQAATSDKDASSEPVDTIVVEAQPDNHSYLTNDASVATRMNGPSLDVPMAVTTVNSQTLSDQGSESLIDALTNVSGVTQTNTIAGKEDAIIRRGFGSSRDGSLLTDGLKTALPHSFNITTESVTVLKGPASSLYGVLDPSGMVNVVTKKPQADFGASIWTKYKAMGAGRFGQVYGFDVTDGLGSSDFSYRLIADYEDSDYWRNFGTNRNWTVAPSVMWQRDASQVILAYMHQDYLAPYDRGTIYDSENGEFLNISRRTRLDESFSAIDGHSDMAKLSYKQGLAGDWSIDTRYAFSEDDFIANQVRVRKYDASTGDITRRADVRGYYKRKIHAVRSDVTGDAYSFGMRHQLLLGVSYDNEKTRRAKLQTCNQNSDMNVSDITYDNMEACTYDADSSVLEYETINTASVFGQDQLHLNDSWIVVGGMRYQHYDITGGRGDTQNTDSQGNALLPNGGVVWQYTPDVSLYANVGRTFRPNSSITKEYGNLDPEKGTSYEVGSKYDNGRINSTLAVYYARKKNVAYSESDGDDTIYKTAGLVRSQGVEWDMKAELTSALQATASYAYTDAKVLRDPTYAGKALPNVAKHTASVFLSYDQGSLFTGSDNLRYGGGVHGASKRAADNGNTFYLPQYMLVDLFAAYTFEAKHPVKVQLNLNNVFDKSYYASAIGSNAYSITVGQPFNATLNVSMAFGAM